MNWFTKMFTPEEKSDWCLCAQFDEEYSYTQTDRKTGELVDEKNQTMTFYLYEDQNGNRKFDVIDEKWGDIDLNNIKQEEKLVANFIYGCTQFRNKIRPWLDGRYDPEIPDYETIPKNDFQNRLAKKKIK